MSPKSFWLCLQNESIIWSFLSTSITTTLVGESIISYLDSCSQMIFLLLPLVLFNIRLHTAGRVTQNIYYLFFSYNSPMTSQFKKLNSLSWLTRSQRIYCHMPDLSDLEFCDFPLAFSSLSLLASFLFLEHLLCSASGHFFLVGLSVWNALSTDIHIAWLSHNLKFFTQKST